MERSTKATNSALAPFAVTALAVVAVWWWLGAPVQLPAWPLLAGHKLSCVSYAPFRDGQDPLIEGTYVEPAQIDADLALLANYTDCVRTYSIENGLDHVAEIAQRHGLKVLQGLWLSSNAEKNRQQIATTIALAKKFPKTIEGVIVGNEVLLRGDMSVNDLIAIIREVKAQVPEPVSYADVWEFWLRYRDVASAVDFVTIHILPYWEDIPVRAKFAAAHVDDQLAHEFVQLGFVHRITLRGLLDCVGARSPRIDRRARSRRGRAACCFSRRSGCPTPTS